MTQENWKKGMSVKEDHEFNLAYIESERPLSHPKPVTQTIGHLILELNRKPCSGNTTKWIICI